MMFPKIRRKLHVTPSGVIAIIALVFAPPAEPSPRPAARAGQPAVRAGISLGRATASAAHNIDARDRGQEEVPKPPRAVPRAPRARPALRERPAQQVPREQPARLAALVQRAVKAKMVRRARQQGATGATGPQGEKGTTGYVKTLPSKATEYGTWSISDPPKAEESYQVTASISFTIPLAKTLGASEVHYVNETGSEEVILNPGFVLQPASGSCSGTVAEPTAAPGALCVYQQHEAEGGKEATAGLADAFIRPADVGPEVLTEGAGASGALVTLETNELSEPDHEPAIARGAWAVTAP